MKRNKEILIIGAGSTGLSLALFLSEAGYVPRIVDKRPQPATITKALGVNPNTLKLLEASGITKRFLQNGNKISCFNFWCRHKLIYKNDVSRINHPYPFMLVQPQHETEGIIEEALRERGISVERGIGLEALTHENNVAKISLKNEEGEISHLDLNGIVVGADGNKSRVRECLGIPFKGWEHHEEFSMVDIELETPLSHREGHYHFFKEGGMLMLHIRDGVWRVAANIKDMLNYLPKGTKTGKISWDTKFTIREMVASQFSRHNVYLLGDAAHIHSPAGAKGMNMCIEDAHIFAQLLSQGREAEYHALRYPKIKKTVGLLGQVTDKVAGHNIVGNTIRHNMDKLSFAFPILMPRFRKFLLGIS